MRKDRVPHPKAQRTPRRETYLLKAPAKPMKLARPAEFWFSGSGSAYHRIYETVRRIPKGKVATYGQIAAMVGRITARMVGYAMAALRGRTDVPWQRVINYEGGISPRAAGDGSIRQRILLEGEGIRFDSRGRVDLKKVRWNGEAVPRSGKEPSFRRRPGSRIQ